MPGRCSGLRHHRGGATCNGGGGSGAASTGTGSVARAARRKREQEPRVAARRAPRPAAARPRRAVPPVAAPGPPRQAAPVIATGGGNAGGWVYAAGVSAMRLRRGARLWLPALLLRRQLQADRGGHRNREGQHAGDQQDQRPLLTEATCGRPHDGAARRACVAFCEPELAVALCADASAAPRAKASSASAGAKTGTEGRPRAAA